MDGQNSRNSVPPETLSEVRHSALQLEVLHPLEVASRHSDMDEHEQLSTTPSKQQYWWVEAWAGARARFIAIATEMIVSVGLLLGLATIYFSLRLLILAGVPAEELDFLKRADLWAVKAVFLTFSFAFVIQSVIGSYASITSSINSIKENN